MSQRAALLISLALTVVTLLGAVGVVVRVMGANRPAVESAAVDSGDSAEPDLEALVAEELEQLQRSNSALAASYERIASLLQIVDQLQGQNAELRDRERVYQERLAEANRRLAEGGQTAVTVPIAPEAPVAQVPAEVGPAFEDAAADISVDAEAVAPGREAPSVVAELPAPPVIGPAAPSRPVAVVSEPESPSQPTITQPAPPFMAAVAPTATPASAAPRSVAPTATPTPRSVTAQARPTVQPQPTPRSRQSIQAIATQTTAIVQAAIKSRSSRESSDGRRKERDGDRDRD